MVHGVTAKVITLGVRRMYGAVGPVYHGIWSYASLLECTSDVTEIELALRSRWRGARKRKRRKKRRGVPLGCAGARAFHVCSRGTWYVVHGTRDTCTCTCTCGSSRRVVAAWRQKDGNIRCRHNRFHLLRRHSLPDKNATPTKSFRCNLTSLAARSTRPPRAATICAPFRHSRQQTGANRTFPLTVCGTERTHATRTRSSSVS